MYPKQFLKEEQGLLSLIVFELFHESDFMKIYYLLDNDLIMFFVVLLWLFTIWFSSFFDVLLKK